MPKVASSPGDQTIGFRLDDGTIMALKAAAAADERTPSQLIRKLIRDYLQDTQPAENTK